MEGPGQAGVKCRPCPEPIARLVQLQTPGSKRAGAQGKFIGSQRGQAQRWASGPAGARVSDVIVTGPLPVSALLSCAGRLLSQAGWSLLVAQAAPGSSSPYPIGSATLVKGESQVTVRHRQPPG